VTNPLQAPRPWYREPWPWLLMAGPAAAVVAGAATLWIAVASADGLVADDYYKQGLAINQVIHREEAAARYGVTARVDPAPGRIRVRLEGAMRQPEALFAQLAHATRAGNDLRLRLAPAGANRYEAELPPLPAGRWRLAIEDPGHEWRVAGDWPEMAAPFTLGTARQASGETGEGR
jgi:uncharacterized protein